jgi:hypothetical protein
MACSTRGCLNARIFVVCSSIADACADVQGLCYCGSDLEGGFLAGCTAKRVSSSDSDGVTVTDGHPVRVLPGCSRLDSVHNPLEILSEISGGNEEYTIGGSVYITRGGLASRSDSRSPKWVGVSVGTSPFCTVDAKLTA